MGRILETLFMSEGGVWNWSCCSEHPNIYLTINTGHPLQIFYSLFNPCGAVSKTLLHLDGALVLYLIFANPSPHLVAGPCLQFPDVSLDPVPNKTYYSALRHRFLFECRICTGGSCSCALPAILKTLSISSLALTTRVYHIH